MTNTNESTVYVYVGTFTRRGGTGMHIYRFDPATGDLDLVGKEPADNPAFLAIHPNKRYLYAVNEVGEFQGEPTGAVSAYEIDPDTGELSFLNQQISHGKSPCFVTVDQEGEHVYLANYASGTAAVYPIQADGSLGEASDVVQHEGSGPNSNRQQGPHAHSINLDPSGRFAYVADLGIDRLMIYDVAETPGKLTPNTVPYVEVAGGSGPRHFTFHPGGGYAYLINEMGNTITAFAYNDEDGSLTELQTVPTLPEDFEGKNTTADIHVDPTGRFLYGSNRGHDSLVIYWIDPGDGTLSYVGHQSTLGETPRNFNIDPTGAFLLAANQDTDNIVVFRRDPETGKLTPTGAEIEVSMPVCIKFLVR